MCEIISFEPLIVLHVHSGESAGAIGVQRLKGQFLCELLPLGLLLSVEAAGVAVSGEVQLRVSTEAGAEERRRRVRDERGDMDWWRVRWVQKRQGERE